MADKDQYSKDEYQFDEVDDTSPDVFNEEQGAAMLDDDIKPGTGANVIRRNAAIAIGLVLFSMLLYKFFGSSHEEEMVAPETLTQPIQEMPVFAPPPIEAPRQTAESDPQVMQRLSALDSQQQNARSELTIMGNQLGTVEGSLSRLATRVDELNRTLSELKVKLDEQAQRDVRPTPVIRRPPPRAVRKPAVTTRYHLQAVIPGRAWLIAENGSTLTVGEGTLIPGYGKVKLIDPEQGVVTMTSGQLIKFSQADS